MFRSALALCAACLAVVCGLGSMASARQIVPYEGMAGGPVNGAPSYYFGTDLDHGFYLTFAMPISAAEPLTFTGLSGYFVGLGNDISATDVRGWFTVWEDLAAFGAGAAPNVAQALHPTFWSLQSDVADDQGLFVYSAHWELPGTGQLPLGSGLVGGTVWGEDPYDSFGVLSNPNSELPSSVYTDDLTVPGYTDLAALDEVGVPACNAEFSTQSVPEPSSIVMILGLAATGAVFRWRHSRRQGLPFPPR